MALAMPDLLNASSGRALPNSRKHFAPPDSVSVVGAKALVFSSRCQHHETDQDPNSHTVSRQQVDAEGVLLVG